MWVLLIILLLSYFITGLIKNILLIIDYIERKEAKLDEKYPYRKKLEE